MANGTLKVSNIQTSSGSGTITIGQSGETVNIPSGCTIANSGTATGFGGGKVLQVVTATDSTQRDVTSTSYVTGSNTLSVNITPSSTSSKILVMYNTAVYKNGNNQVGNTTLYRDSTNLGDSTNGLSYFYIGSDDVGQQVSASLLDSPSSTSQITYQVYVRTSAGTFSINYQSCVASITAMEIAG
jgi:hypothetical protein